MACRYPIVRLFTVPVFIALSLGLQGCIDYIDSSSDKSSSVSDPATQASIARVEAVSFDIVDDGKWNDTAVRRVLHTFAYGGHATDEQIARWAEQPPQAAIVQMLTFNQHNQRLSPMVSSDTDGMDTRDGTLGGLAGFWSSDDPANGLAEVKRANHTINKRVDFVWRRAATTRGLNPFRQKIGFWETNNHMATTLESNVKPHQMVRYYDDIMTALEMDWPYQDVISTAASSAAVAMQYGHRNNKFVAGECKCNEDFAREYHQLFFGILGTDDTNYHETVTIKNTARALTDMPVTHSDESGFADAVSFGTENHYSGILEILNVNFWGIDARERIDQLSQYAIDTTESNNNLPVKIISDLADDNLDAAKTATIQSAWISMSEKNLLTFLQAYAISPEYHSETRVKYLSSIDRNILIANKLTLSNFENYLDLYTANSYITEGVKVFKPGRAVFGSQTGLDAADSTSVFRANYNQSTAKTYMFSRTTAEKFGKTWVKDWASVVPRDESGNYVVSEVAEWLWNHFIGDGLKHFGALERAYVYSYLASGSELNAVVYPEDDTLSVSVTETESDPAVLALVNNMAIQTMSLDSATLPDRARANSRVGLAISFIVATPYIFVQEGA